jgi:hypothetical protein
MTTELCHAYGIQDLLPHPNILNFHMEKVSLPDWATNLTFQLMIGAGDLDQGGILNVHRFPSIDVYACYPWDNGGSLRANIKAFLALPPNTKLMCFIDLENNVHVSKFIKLFKGKFSRIEGHGPHTPHLNPVDIAEVLTEGGQASNIYERSSNCTSVALVTEWLQCPFPNYISRGHIFEVDANGGYKHLTPEVSAKVADLFRIQIRKYNSENRHIKVEEDYLSMIDTWSLVECQTVLSGLLFERQTPLTLYGIIQPFEPIWCEKERPELIYTKISPKFFHETIHNYVSTFGTDDKVERLTLIHDKIQEDLSMKRIFEAKAKYNTYRKKIDSLFAKK